MTNKQRVALPTAVMESYRSSTNYLCKKGFLPLMRKIKFGKLWIFPQGTEDERLFPFTVFRREMKFRVDVHARLMRLRPASF